MGVDGSIIETGVDKLVKLVKKSGKIALSEAASELGVSTEVIHEWVEFLEEEGIVSIEYKLTKPFIVERKLTKKEVEQKAKEFTNKKDVFVRKAEGKLKFLERQAAELKGVKKEFDDIKNELGLELDSVREEFKELEGYQKLKEDLENKINNQKNEFKVKIEELAKSVQREKRKYQDLVSGIKKERNTLSKELQEAKTIEKTESLLKKRLSDLKLVMGAMEKKIENEDIAIKNSELHLQKLNALMEEVSKRSDQEKESILPLIEKSEDGEKKIMELQKNIIKKISEKQKNTKSAKDMSKKVKAFFEKKLAVVNLVDKVNKDRDDLEKSLIDLVKKAKSFQLSAKKGDVGKDLKHLEKKFNDVEEKKTVFEKELKKLSSFFGK